MTQTAWLAPNPYVLSLPVQPDAIDDFNHVNNVVYLGWMSRAAWAHSKALGFDFAAYQALDCGFVVRRHEIDYRVAALADDIVHIGTWVSENDGRLYLRRRFQLISDTTGATLALGMSQFVAMKISSGRACRMPKAFAEGYPANPEIEAIFRQKAGG